jgi:hypothetical protein
MPSAIVGVGPPGGVEGALDGAGQLHPPGERRGAIAGVVDDAGDGVCPQIEDDRQPGMIRWHGGKDAFPRQVPHRVEPLIFMDSYPENSA